MNKNTPHLLRPASLRLTGLGKRSAVVALGLTNSSHDRPCICTRRGA